MQHNFQLFLLTTIFLQDIEGASTKKLTQTGTQTSPENAVNPPVKGHFSIGTGNKEEKLSPKAMRKDRGGGKSRPKRAISPASMHQLPKATYQASEPVKQAMSPSVAEALRAVFAAFLWHEVSLINQFRMGMIQIFVNIYRD